MVRLAGGGALGSALLKNHGLPPQILGLGFCWLGKGEKSVVMFHVQAAHAADHESEAGSEVTDAHATRAAMSAARRRRRIAACPPQSGPRNPNLINPNPSPTGCAVATYY